MVSYEEAQRLIKDHIPPLMDEVVFISAALGRVCAEDIQCPLDLPGFDNSAMDGFAFSSKKTQDASSDAPIFLKITGSVKAGDPANKRIRGGECVRIMTGAAMPPGTDSVLAKEYAVIREDCLVLSAPPEKGKNIRKKGEEIKKGEGVLKRGAVIHPGTIGFLATMGLDRLRVYVKARVALVATGSELVPPGNVLRSGKIYDSNTFLIRAALEEMKSRPVYIKRIADDSKAIQKIVRYALRESDILILMGGVSVGDHDHVKSVLEQEDVETVFWKVSQKPGKPLYFGRKNSTLVFGLPGNPASVFTCFYEYVYPAIRLFMGHPSPYLSSKPVLLEKSVSSEEGKVLFIKARTESGMDRSQVLRHQKSHMISSLCETNSFLVIENKPPQAHLLPYEVGELV